MNDERETEREPEPLRILRAMEISVEADAEPYVVADRRFLFWPSTGFWRRLVPRPAQAGADTHPWGYEFDKLIAAIKKVDDKADPA